MKGSAWKRRPRLTLGIAVVLVLTALVVVVSAVAAPPQSRPVRTAATIDLSVDGYHYGELFSVGHALINGECGGDGSTYGTKLRVTAVGGDVSIWSGFWNSEGTPVVLHDGETDALVVLIIGPGEGPTTSAFPFAVFDDTGASFSGTGAAKIASTGCLLTAQVAG